MGAFKYLDISSMGLVMHQMNNVVPFDTTKVIGLSVVILITPLILLEVTASLLSLIRSFSFVFETFVVILAVVINISSFFMLLLKLALNTKVVVFILVIVILVIIFIHQVCKLESLNLFQGFSFSTIFALFHVDILIKIGAIAIFIAMFAVKSSIIPFTLTQHIMKAFS